MLDYKKQYYVLSSWESLVLDLEILSTDDSPLIIEERQGHSSPKGRPRNQDSKYDIV